MLRFIGWTLLYLATLGYISIDVLYSDGLHIVWHGWGGKTGKKEARRG